MYAISSSNGSNSVEATTTETKRILSITATNHTLTNVIANMNLTPDQRERYEILLETKGNRPYLFEDDIYSNAGGEYTDYDIPGELLRMFAADMTPNPEHIHAIKEEDTQNED